MNPIPISGRSLLAAALLVSSALCAQAKVLPLTKTIIDYNNSRVDFGLPTIPTPSGPWTHDLAAGDTIEIEGHTRKQLVLLRINPTGADTNPVTITNKPGTQFIIDSTDTNFKKGLTMSGCSNFILTGTYIPDPPPATTKQPGIVIAQTPPDASGVVVTQYGGGNSGIPVVGATNFDVSHMVIGHTGFAGVFIKCDSVTGSSGVSMDNVRIHHLNIHDTGGEGMYIGASDFATQDRQEIHGIEIHHNDVTNSGWDGIQLGCATQNASIHDNNIVGYGLLAGSLTDQDEGIRSNPGTRADIYSNVIIGSPTNSGTGIFADPYNSVKIYNNVIVTPQERGIYILDSAYPKAYTVGYQVTLANNTIIQPGTFGIEFANPAHSAANRLINNVIVVSPISRAKSMLASLIGLETGNLYRPTVEEIGFVNPGGLDYSLAAGSPAINTGFNAADDGVTADIDGVARPQGAAYDAGAYEYVAAPVIGLITPAGYGQAGTAYCPAAGTFNEPPAWNAGSGVPTGVSASPYTATGTAYANRHWYIDFGPNWGNLRITGTWSRYMPLTTASYPGFGAMWWDNDNDAVNDGITATGLNFCTAQGLNTGSTQPWVRDTNATASPIAPQGRYLIINTGSAPAARVNEFAISGYTVN